MTEHSDNELTYRTLLEEASDGILVFDERGGLHEANPSLCALVGYTREELRGMRAEQLIPPEALAREPIDWEALRNGEVRIVERHFSRKDGGTVPVEVRTRRMRNGRYLSIVRDISARRQADEAMAALRDREEQLRQSQRIEAIGRLAGGVAHDFNNVLTAIMGYTDLLLDDFRSDDPRRQDLTEIKRAAERAAGLTRQLLAFSRKQVLQPVPLDVNVIVGGIDKLLRRLLGDEIEFSFDAGADLGRVMADPGQLEQVLINLAVNARDAMPEGGRLSIATRRTALDDAEARRRGGITPGEYVLLEMSDTGPGIDASIEPHIFEPFFTTKPQGKGTGLGLATVYGIIKQSDGCIFVDRAPGGGARFSIYLPVLRPGADAAPEGARTAAAVVLIVEDEPAVRSLAAGLVRRTGASVIEAADTAAAMRLAETEKRIDLLITDIVMPGGRGDELAHALRASHPALKVIYMSGFSDERVRRDADRLGIPFIQKPFTAHALVKTVNETLTTSP